MENNNLKWYPKVFLRAPLYSFKEYSIDKIHSTIKTRLFKNALFLASPNFYSIIAEKEFESERFSEKEINGLLKYFNRMCFRPTPFGAFASFSLVEWSSDRSIKLAGLQSASLHLLPSQVVLMQALHALPLTNEEELIKLNPTAYRSGNSIRYIKSESDTVGKLSYVLSALDAEELNLMIFHHIQNASLKLGELIAFVMLQTGGNKIESSEYLNFLIEQQFLFSKRQGDIFEVDREKGYFLNKTGFNNGKSSFGDRWPETETMPVLDYGNLSVIAGEWVQSRYGGKSSPDKGIFYGALERGVDRGGILKEEQHALLNAVEVLGRIVPEVTNHALEQFKRAFQDRFDQEKVPLLKALDPDAGIIYGELSDTRNSDNWMNTLNLAVRKESDVSVFWTATHRLFLRKWVGNAERRRDEPIILDDSDLEDFPTFDQERSMPPGLGVMFNRSGRKLVLDMIGGVTAVSLIGRFSVFSDEVAALSRSLASVESHANPDVLFADIAQLSDSHVDNINRRKPIYDHYIPINTFSSPEAGNEIQLRDLVISVRGGEIILESVSKGKRVIPRLATAYNFTLNDLSIFRFLCDLQFQSVKSSYTLDLERLFPGIMIYPRVIYKDVILAPAKWHLTESDIIELTHKPFSLGRLHLFRQKYYLPARITMGFSDQQLTFDLSNDQEAMLFLNSIYSAKKVVLKEFLMPGDELNIDGKPFSGQHVAFLQKKSKTYQGIHSSAKSTSLVQRRFLTGSDWVYLKIYTHTRLANDLLVQVIAPVIESFHEKVQRWFFIRYADPSSHLRVRINIHESEIGNFLIAMKQAMEASAYNEFIREYQSDVYGRELERYGFELIEDIEEYFCIGSKMVVCWLTSLKNTPEMLEPHLLAIKLTYLLAREFWKDGELFKSFLENRAKALRMEFGNEKEVRLSFDQKFREVKKSLDKLLHDGAVNLFLPDKKAEEEMVNLMSRTDFISSKSIDWDLRQRQHLIGDLIHMQLNRLFSVQQRSQEALVFHCLAKHMGSIIAREKKGLSV